MDTARRKRREREGSPRCPLLPLLSQEAGRPAADGSAVETFRLQQSLQFSTQKVPQPVKEVKLASAEQLHIPTQASLHLVLNEALNGLTPV